MRWPKRRSLWLISSFVVLLFPLGVLAASLPTGEHAVGNTVIEPAYDDSTGTIVYLHTPNTLAPLGSHPFGGNQHAAAPLYIVAYPAGVNLTLNCMAVPGNCPDHDGVIATVATGLEPDTYGTDPTAVPGHDHLVGKASTGGDFNVPWHVYVELFTSPSAVTHITTLAQLQAAWTSGAVLTTTSGMGVDTGITFICGIVSQFAYDHGSPVS
jgi:hypothetical protein